MSDDPAAQDRGRTPRARRWWIAATVLALYAPYTAMWITDRCHAHCSLLLAKLLPIAPGFFPAHVTIAATQLEPPQTIVFGFAALVTVAQLWLFVRWTARGSRWSAPIAFAIHLLPGYGLGQMIRA